MDEVDARNLVAALRARGMLDRKLLLQHASTNKHGLEPDKFLGKLMRQGIATSAAIPGPSNIRRRETLVNKGTDEHGQQRPGPLSPFAMVFYPRQSGDWISRQVESRTHKPGDPVSIEFIYQGRGRPEVQALGVIEIDDDGTVVRIVETNAEAVPGGAGDFVKIMQKAGWTVKLRGR
jgi:hypothetical protein